MRGRTGAASALYVQPRVFFLIDHDHGMRWQRRYVSCLWRRSGLHGGQRPGGPVQLLSGVFIDLNHIELLRHHFVHVPCD